MTTLTVRPPEGGPTYWLAYDNGEVWPCGVLSPAICDHWTVIPTHPAAPGYGERLIEPRRRIYDGTFKHPEMVRS